MSTTEFVPPDFIAPTEVTFGDMRLVPLGPEHNAADYSAWTSSIDHIRETPGFPWGSWPTVMSLAENLGDLEHHAEDFRLRRGFTYTVLDAEDDVVGCVYIYPSRKEGVDAQVRSWVRSDQAPKDVQLRDALRVWLSEEWPFQNVDFPEGDRA